MLRISDKRFIINEAIRNGYRVKRVGGFTLVSNRPHDQEAINLSNLLHSTEKRLELLCGDEEQNNVENQ